MCDCNRHSCKHCGTVKRYTILLKKGGKWWTRAITVNAYNADEAADYYVSRIGCNPPNEFAVQSTKEVGKQYAFLPFIIYRVKPRTGYVIEAV